MAKKKQVDTVELAAHARQRILDVLGVDTQKALSIKELSTALRTPEPIGTSTTQREKLAKEAVNQLLKEKDRKIYEHPKIGNSSVRYGASRADARKYFTKTGLDKVQTKYAQLLNAGVEPRDIVAAIGEKLTPSYRADVTLGRNDQWLEQVVEQVRQFTQRRPSESYPLPQLYREVVEPLGVSLGEFLGGLRRLSREGRILLIEWTQPLRTMPDERFALIAGGEIRYYARIS